ncbi:TMhelix containing protein [Vibrio phage 1.009.O._10N.261.51.C9]|nr:TMhelix containing protein [Vibrio phage 1.009.O._10N.261.51.C9]
MSQTHALKIMPVYFADVLAERKPFEIRKNDRNYRPGDRVILREWDKISGYSGRTATGTIGAVVDYAQAEDYVVFAFLMEYAEDTGDVLYCKDPELSHSFEQYGQQALRVRFMRGMYVGLAVAGLLAAAARYLGV